MTAIAHAPPALASPRSLPLLLAAIGPIAIGGLIAAPGGTLAPLFAVPAVVFGVTAATSPALYIATAATGTAPPLASVVRAFGVAIGAFGVALAGLLLPVTFLALSSAAPSTTFVVTSAAIGAAGFLGFRRLAHELRANTSPSLAGVVVFVVWALATCGIAGRMWWDLAKEVLS